MFVAFAYADLAVFFCRLVRPPCRVAGAGAAVSWPGPVREERRRVLQVAVWVPLHRTKLRVRLVFWYVL